jgi:hypothetical protein
MNEGEMQKLVDAWIEGAEHGRTPEGRTTPVYQETWWATSMVINWKYDHEPEMLWRFILEVHKRETSPKVVAVLAAGPVEDLLSEFGDTYIDRIEDLAQKDARFKWMLGGVWQDGMSEELWYRLQKARENVTHTG